MRRLATFLLLTICSLSMALEPMPFRDAQEESRFRALVAELRCVMCQNQSLADSNAPIAHDLRKEVFELMQSGKSDDEIKTFLTERYTDFVLYRPPMEGHTLYLWIAPPALLVLGAVVLFFVVRGRNKDGNAAPLQPDDNEDWS